MECAQNLERESYRYFAVTAKCGHVGKNVYIPITFAVKAESKKIAAKITRMIPRVKHDHKDAILDVKELDKFEWIELSNENHNNPYLQCSSIQEQRSKIEEFELELLTDNHNDFITKTNKKDSLEYRRKKQNIINKEIKKERNNYKKEYIY